MLDLRFDSGRKPREFGMEAAYWVAPQMSEKAPEDAPSRGLNRMDGLKNAFGLKRPQISIP